jgi:hypothetical protein
MKRTKELRAKK